MSIAAQLSVLGFSRFTVHYDTPAFPPEDGRVRVRRAPIWIDVFAAEGAAIVIPDYDTLTKTAVPQSKDDADADSVKKMAPVANFVNLSPSQIDNFIENNVTDLAGAKAILKVIGKALSISARAVFK